MLNEKRFEKIMSRIGRVATLLDTDIQECAVYAIHQSIEYRNAAPADRLFQIVKNPRGMMRADALARYFEQHGNLAYMKEDKKIAFFEVKDIAFDEKQLMALPWREAIAPKDPDSIYDAKEMFEALLVRIEKKIKAGKDEVKNTELVTKIRKVMAEGALEEALGTIQAS